MKTNTELLRLESVITNEKTIIHVNNTNGSTTLKAMRFANHRRKEKTHTLTLDSVSSKLAWKNNRGQEWNHQFESTEHAETWWNDLIISRASN